jgi:HK97 family phage prohead protease
MAKKHGTTLKERRALARRLDGSTETRSIGGGRVNLRAAGNALVLSGYASVVETPYAMGFYDETIARGAFRNTLAKNPDVQLLVNHEGQPYARTTIRTGPGSLKLAEDHHGLRVDAELDPGDPDAALLLRRIRLGLIDQMSFAFSGARSEWDEDMTQRRIVSLDIDRGDVSVVNQGANPATSITAGAATQTNGRPSLDTYLARGWALGARGATQPTVTRPTPARYSARWCADRLAELRRRQPQ